MSASIQVNLWCSCFIQSFLENTHTQTDTDTHTNKHTQAHTSTHLRMITSLTHSQAYVPIVRETMFTTSFCIFWIIFCMSYYTTKVVQWLFSYTTTKKTNHCCCHMLTVHFCCIWCVQLPFLFSIGSTLNSCNLQKVPNTHISVSNSRFRFLPYKHHGSIKGNIILHDITITNGPNVETLWTPKAQL